MKHIERNYISRMLLKVLQGSLIGLGAVLPGISGGVLSVIFGIYKSIMELLADPLRNFKTHVPRLFPYIVGAILGFLGIAKLLALVLERYPEPSVCLFVGLIAGMLPSLWEEAGKEGRSKESFIATIVAMIAVFTLLFVLQRASITINPSFRWYLFCGFCLALSVIAPGISFSTLLMPLDLYTPFVNGIGNLSPEVLIPGGIGGLLTIICLSRMVNYLFDRHYSVAFHAIVGIVITATVMIIPFDNFFHSQRSFIVNTICLIIGIAGATWLEHFNKQTAVSIVIE